MNNKVNKVYSFNDNLPPVGVEINVYPIGVNKPIVNTLLKVEWIDNKVIYTWAKFNQFCYVNWSYINEK